MKPSRTQLAVFLAWLPAIAWIATIFVLSSLPPVIPPETEPRFGIPTDKLAHIAAYALLACLVLFALRRAHNLPVSTTVLLTIVLTAGYGAIDEWHQSFVPNRHGGLDDWIADAIGAVLVGLAWYLYETRRSKKTNR